MDTSNTLFIDRQPPKFADRLQEARKAAGYSSAKKFAAALEISYNTYQRYEAGSEPSYSRLCDICLLLNTTPNDLLGFQDNLAFREAVSDARKAGLIVSSVHRPQTSKAFSGDLHEVEISLPLDNSNHSNVKIVGMPQAHFIEMMNRIKNSPQMNTVQSEIILRAVLENAIFYSYVNNDCNKLARLEVVPDTPQGHSRPRQKE